MSGAGAKELLRVALVVILAAGCETSKLELPSTSRQLSTTSNFSTPTILTESNVLRIGNQYAQDKGWELRRSPTRARFVSSKGEWQMHFAIKNRGGPFTVYVNDATGVVRFVAGE